LKRFYLRELLRRDGGGGTLKRCEFGFGMREGEQETMRKIPNTTTHQPK